MDKFICFVLVVADFDKRTFTEWEYYDFEQIHKWVKQFDGEARMYAALEGKEGPILRPLWQNNKEEWVFKGIDGEIHKVN